MSRIDHISTVERFLNQTGPWLDQDVEHSISLLVEWAKENQEPEPDPIPWELFTWNLLLPMTVVLILLAYLIAKFPV